MAESAPAFNMEDWVNSRVEGEDLKRWEDEFVSHYVDGMILSFFVDQSAEIPQPSTREHFLPST